MTGLAVSIVSHGPLIDEAACSFPSKVMVIVLSLFLFIEIVGLDARSLTTVNRLEASSWYPSFPNNLISYSPSGRTAISKLNWPSSIG